MRRPLGWTNNQVGDDAGDGGSGYHGVEAPAAPNDLGASGAHPPGLPTVEGYRVVGRLGGNATADVFLAVDPALGRRVALKLFPSIAGNGEATARIARDTRAAAALSHPSIVTIYEVGVARAGTPGRGPARFVAMELVEGEAFDRYLERERPTLDRILTLVVQVAEGMGRAHRVGLYHGALDPAQLMVSRDGFAKILGLGLGALGKGGSARGDLCALGGLLERAATASRRWKRWVSLTKSGGLSYVPLPDSTTQASLERVVARCYADPAAGGYRDAKELADELRTLSRESDSVVAMVPSATGDASKPRPGRRQWLWLGIALLTTATVAGASLSLLRPRTDDEPAPTTPVAASKRLTHSGNALAAAISPDGRWIAYVLHQRGRQSLWVHQVATGSRLQLLAPAPVYYRALTVSPDGNHILFVRRTHRERIGRLWRVAIFGGSPAWLADDVDSGVTFSPDGRRLAFVRHGHRAGRSGLFVAGSDGRQPRLLVDRSSSQGPRLPAWSPTGDRIAFAARLPGSVRIGVFTAMLEDGRVRQLGTTSWVELQGLHWLPQGRGLVVAASGAASRIRQIWRLTHPAGTARRVTRDASDYSGLSLTRDASSLVTGRVEQRANIWTSAPGEPNRVRRITDGSSRYAGLAWAPDGQVVYTSLQAGGWNLWAMNGDGSQPRPLTVGAAADIYPAVSPDGRMVAFLSDRAGVSSLWVVPMQGGEPRRLTLGPHDMRPAFSPDGRWIFYSAFRGRRPSTWKVPLAGGPPIQVSDRYTLHPVVSEDGREFAAQTWDEVSGDRLRLGVFSALDGRLKRSFSLPRGAHLHFHSPARWIPNGGGLSYVVRRNGISNLWVQPLDGGRPGQLTRFRSNTIYQFDWQPRTARLVMVRGLRTTDVFLLSRLRWNARESAL